MAVGAGSIKRASKLNAAVEENIVKAPEKENASDITASTAAATPKKEEVSAVAKATKPKKTASAGTKAAAKKTTSAGTKKEADKKTKTTTSAKTSVQEKPSGNEVCHLTEELPVYLL